MKEFKPISMRCNQQQYDEIKQILIDNGCKLNDLNGDFEKYYSYLVNNQGGKKNNICNMSKSSIEDFNRKFFDKWNKDIFLEYCGITVKKPELTELPDEHVDKQNNTLNMDKILEEAKLKYPIGTKFIPIRRTGEICDNIILQEKECYLYKNSENYEWVIGSDNIYNPIINKWAEIIESPKTNNNNYEKPEINTEWIPQVGDYVITKGYSKDYDGRILKINKIGGSSGKCYWFDVNDRGYYKNHHNFGKNHILRKAEPHEIPKTESLLEKILHFTPDPFLSLQGIGYENKLSDYSVSNLSSKKIQFIDTSTVKINQPTTNQINLEFQKPVIINSKKSKTKQLFIINN